jgi:WD40 repeat protein
MDGVPIGLSADGTRVAIIEGQYRSTVAVRRVADGALLASRQAPNFYDNGMGGQRGPIVLTPDLSLVLFADFPAHVVLTEETMSDGAVVARSCGTGHTSEVVGLAVSRDGDRLVSSGYLGDEVPELVFDTHTGAPVNEPPPADVETIDPTSPNGRYVAVPRAELYFDVRDTHSQSPVAVFGPHITRVTKVDWSDNGRQLVSMSERDPVDRGANPTSVKVWDFASKALVQTLETVADNVPALFAPDNQQLYVGDWGNVQAWCR